MAGAAQKPGETYSDAIRQKGVERVLAPSFLGLSNNSESME
jgi:hypothetical protein